MTKTLTFIEILQNGINSELIFEAVESGFLKVAEYDDDGLPSFDQDDITKISAGEAPENFRGVVVQAFRKRAERLSKNADVAKSIAKELSEGNDVKLRKKNVRKIVPAGTPRPLIGVDFELEENEIDAGV